MIAASPASSQSPGGSSLPDDRLEGEGLTGAVGHHLSVAKDNFLLVQTGT